MIFDKRVDLRYAQEQNTEWSLSVSYNDGTPDFYEMDFTRIVSDKGTTRMLVERAHHICSDSYYAYATFDRKDFDTLLQKLHRLGVQEIHTILTSLPSYRAVRSGKAEDLKDYEEEHLYQE